MATEHGAKRDTLNIRVKPELRGLIDRAACLRGKNRTDFVLDAARHAAEDALLDRTIFAVDSKAYNDFLRRLDAPPRPNNRLRRTLRTPPPWRALPGRLALMLVLSRNNPSPLFVV